MTPRLPLGRATPWVLAALSLLMLAWGVAGDRNGALLLGVLGLVVAAVSLFMGRHRAVPDDDERETGEGEGD